MKVIEKMLSYLTGNKIKSDRITKNYQYDKIYFKSSEPRGYEQQTFRR